MCALEVGSVDFIHGRSGAPSVFANLNRESNYIYLGHPLIGRFHRNVGNKKLSPSPNRTAHIIATKIDMVYFSWAKRNP